MSEEEREVVQSLFCLPEECEFHENEVHINTVIDGLQSAGSCSIDSVKTKVRIVFLLGKNYPNQLPQMSVFSEILDREEISRVKSKVLQSCSDLLGEPMLISLISSVQENIQIELESKQIYTQRSDETQAVHGGYDSTKIWTCVLHIDHMRSKNKYCKTLEKWASELSLCGKILFCNKLILVLLQGDIESIKDFVVRLKTVNVDVDSKGHSCKERMMTVLCEKQYSIDDVVRLADFERREVENREQLEKLFQDITLSQLYKEHVSRLH